MLAIFKAYCSAQQLFKSSDTILLAVSGGVDSMVMAHLFRTAGFNFGIAHCNFKLRGKDSDADAQLVQQWTEDWEVPFHLIAFDTKAESEKRQLSIEMTARELRYQWFGELLQKNDYQYVATAHHLNDSLETLLLNLIKGTGIRGLHGIPISNGKIIRPLSFATRDEILTYAKAHAIAFREDASNQSEAIQRNRIRHQVVPVFKKINPALEKTFAKTLAQFRDTETLYLWAVEQQRKALLITEKDRLKIAIVSLKKAVAVKTVLYEIIHEFGFNSDHVTQILRAIDHVGAQFYSKTHHILIERQFIIIKNKKKPNAVWLEIEMLPEQLALPNGEFRATILPNKPIQLNLGKMHTLIDLAKIKLPLTIRNWKEGDRFQPLGMQGKSKKVKDYLRDNKVSIFDKQRVLVVESDDKIIWLVGFRADERFKVEDTTKTVLQLSVQ